MGLTAGKSHAWVIENDGYFPMFGWNRELRSQQLQGTTMKLKIQIGTAAKVSFKSRFDFQKFWSIRTRKYTSINSNIKAVYRSRAQVGCTKRFFTCTPRQWKKHPSDNSDHLQARSYWLRSSQNASHLLDICGQTIVFESPVSLASVLISSTRTARRTSSDWRTGWTLPSTRQSQLVTGIWPWTWRWSTAE